MAKSSGGGGRSGRVSIVGESRYGSAIVRAGGREYGRLSQMMGQVGTTIRRNPQFKFRKGDPTQVDTADGVRVGTFVRYQNERIGRQSYENVVIDVNGKLYRGRKWSAKLVYKDR